MVQNRERIPGDDALPEGASMSLLIGVIASPQIALSIVRGLLSPDAKFALWIQ
jgi:hypothetical protein